MSLLDDILQNLDFVDLVNRKTTVKRTKGEEYKGLSPFNKEKTPSFYINNHSKTWYDFSSGQGGGVIDYVMKTENLGKSEAIHFLADFAGVEIEEEDELAKLRHVLITANKYFRMYASEAVPYLESRGFSPEIVAKYKLGFAPNNDNLIAHLQTAGHSDEDILTSGVGFELENGTLVSRYKNRVIFPIKDAYGLLVSFTGRDVTGSAKAKYLHGPVSPLFKKKDVVWNLSDIRNLITETEKVILCEGQMDALAISEAGLPAVALLGATPSEAQLQLLSKLTQNLYLIFDSDNAGQRGMVKAFKMISNLDADALLYSLILPGGKDPDEFIRENGTEAFQKLVEHSKPDTSIIVQTLIRQNAGKNRTKAAVTRRVIQELLPYIQQQFTYRSLDLIERLSQELGLSRKELQDWIEKGGNFTHSSGVYEKIKDISFPAPIYERRILYGLLDEPSRIRKFKESGLSDMDFESFLVSKVASNISASLDSAQVFEVLQEKLEEDEYYKVLAFYSQGLQDTDFESALNVMKIKVFDRVNTPMTDFLGRPLASTEKELRGVVRDIMDREPF